MSKSILSAKGVFKSYFSGGYELKVLKGIDLEVEPAQIVAIVGASGSGKTTLLNAIGMIDSPDRGEIWWEEKLVSRMSEGKIAKLRAKLMGFVFQHHCLIPELTVLENVALPLMMDGISKKQALEKAEEFLHFFGIIHTAWKFPANISMGEAQRAAVARAMVRNPRVVLADEPTGNLDHENMIQIKDYFLKIRDKNGISFIIVTHNMELAQCADIVFELKNGKLEKLEVGYADLH